MFRRVLLHRLAERDLDAILSHVAMDSLANAEAFVDRIEDRCLSLSEMPHWGRRRRDLPGDVRELVFEGRVVIVYAIGSAEITILRILYGGRNAPSVPPIPDD
ncbi:hypothetical protein GCM10011390_46460 [Aureimonas endophytica]|uniref:Toxin ParE1/3/4 n=1 Tax=Aureimonas endophytica TaxID=2027858 RepID=A0A917ED12_9HYPH|nr:type II toxin-antitoxin system RelE/ParE family toxin [Aureimonas endophytica]GGE21819.1 hypothetical protein GCM10011390_46460 [Aureimonas endophytica]